jgi:hypothetical protein
MEDEILIRMLQPLIKFNLSLFHHSHTFYIISITNINFLSHSHHHLIESFPRVKLLFHQDILIYRQANLDTYAACYTFISLKPTLRSVNGDVLGSRFSSPVTSMTPSSCTWNTSFRSPLRKLMQFCKSSTVMTVVLSHYMKLNTIRTI